MTITLTRHIECVAMDEEDLKDGVRLHPSPSLYTSTSASDTQASGQATQVLIVEDNRALRETLSEILRGSGYEVTEVADGDNAVKVLESTYFDVLLLDLHIPKRDGVDVLREISPPPPVVIILSAFEYYSEQDVRDRVGSKVFRYLRKPASPQKMLDAIAEAVEEWRGTE